MSLLVDGEPFELFPHQKVCAKLAMTKNLICAQPTGDGKTIIAADVIRQTLEVEEEKKVVFLAPYGALAQQQYQVFRRHIDRLHVGDDVTPNEDASEAELARWRIGLCVGAGSGAIPELSTDYRDACRECQLLVMTPALFERALTHNVVGMRGIALLVFDEAHEASEKSHHFYSTILKYFYCPCESPRPRVLALTATPVKEPDVEKSLSGNEIERTPQKAREGLKEFEQLMHCRVWSAEVERNPTRADVPEFIWFTPDDWQTSDIAQIVLSAVERCKPACKPDAEAEAQKEAQKESEQLAELWSKRILPKLRSVADQLGVWACFEAADLLVHELRAGLQQEESCFAEEDEGRERQMESGQTKLARKQVQEQAAEKLERELRSIADNKPSAEEAYSKKVGRLRQYLQEKSPDKCLVFAERRLTCKLLAALLRSLLAPPQWTVDGLMAQRAGADAFSAAEYRRAIGDFRAHLR